MSSNHSPTVRLKYMTFHPAIWPKMVGEVRGNPKPGALVQVLGKQGDPFGVGFWNPHARLPLRLVHHRPAEAPDEAFFPAAIRAAAELRREILRLDEDTDTYRAIHADSDRLPGLVADKFGDVMSLEVTTLAAWQRLDTWLPEIHEAFGTSRAVIRIDPALAKIERIPSLVHPLSDPLRKVKVREHGTTFEIDLEAGHKTGFFCDQRENRRRAAAMARGRRMLDLCCYTGGFSINAARAGAADVTAVDLDEQAVSMARRNANINNVKNSSIHFIHADAFGWARQMVENQRRWDFVVLDPPKFITGRDDRLGHNKYHDLNSLALQLVEPGGLFVTCSCSGRLDAAEFERIVAGAAHRKDMRLQVLARTGAGPDHPCISNYPEARYLKVLWCRVM
jgi:23S rRNA (cytosine1962-C5)-methyltransferase